MNYPRSTILPELETACVTIEDLHDEIMQLLREVGPVDINWNPGAGYNSIYALLTHSIASQRWWICENLAGRVIERNRPAEFTASGHDFSVLETSLEEVQEETREILRQFTQGDLEQERVVKGRVLSVRWIVMHVIEHTALHLGHMQMTQQWLQDRK